MEIKADQHYTPDDLEDGKIAKKQTQAQWRHEGKGPAYIKSGSRIIYRGKDVIKWLDARRVEPKAA